MAEGSIYSTVYDILRDRSYMPCMKRLSKFRLFLEQPINPDQDLSENVKRASKFSSMISSNRTAFV